ncbi:MAG: hypothetical protein JSR98_06765 [Proteobacteria bacterium]|nr:hypothetical protein [Pseudomonadota bacterium]
MLFAIATDVLGTLACLFALWKGGRSERIGAAIIWANIIAYVVNETLLWGHLQAQQVTSLVIDGVTAAALLAVALIFASFWLGAVMLFYALQFSLHAFYFVTERPRDTLHAILNNIIFFAVIFCLLAGALLAWRRRVVNSGAAATETPVAAV